MINQLVLHQSLIVTQYVLVFVVKIQIMLQCTLSPCKSKSMDLSPKKTMTQVEWGGILGTYSSGTKNDIKSRKMTNRDYYTFSICMGGEG